MKCPTSQLLLLCALLLLHQCHRNVFVSADEQQLIVLHDPTRQALSSRSQPASVSPAAATATLCAASGLVPPHGVDQATAAHVEGLVPAKSVLGQAPQALLLLHLAGVTPGSDILHKLQQAWGTAGHTLELDVADSKASAGSLLQAASDVVAANPAADVTVLDHSSLQGCAGGSCLPHHLTKAMHHCGGKLHAPSPAQQRSSSKGLQGFLELPGLEQKLDMSLPGVKLFALELAALQGSAQHVFAKLKQQPAEELDKVLSVYESTFVGLQGLAAHFPKGTPEFEAAEAALTDVLGHLVSDVKGVYGDDVLYQVAFLGDAPISSGDAADLMEWKELSRRVLLQRSGNGNAQPLRDDEAGSSKQYAQKATAYGVTLLLIWFTFAGVYCMVAMHFKQDTLLYGRTKTD